MKRVSRKGFTEEEWTARKKEQQRISNKNYRDTHKEYFKEYNKNYQINNKEAISKQRKEHYNTNKDILNKISRDYHSTHKEEKKNYTQSPAGIKTRILSDWKIRGITFGDMTPSDYYDNIYIPALNCMACNKTFNKNNKNDCKCADHLHKETPCNVRGVICFECNLHDNWKKRLTPNSIYQLYL